jgi:hypothetical protein
VYNIAAIATLALSCYFLLRILRLAGVMEYILGFFCLAAAYLVTWGYLLSFMARLSDLRYWSLLGLTTTLVMFFIAISQKAGLQSPARFKFSCVIKSVRDMYLESSRFEKFLLTPLILTVFLLGVINLVIIILTAPHNWDSMTYHLARVAYYLQQNNINYFDANYWAQVVHPKNSHLLLLYTYLVTGKNENLTQLVQFVSYWVAVGSIYAISRKVGNSKSQSVFAAAVAALLTEWLMQSTTTQNDMILTVYVGSAVYFLFAFRETQDWKYLGLAALGVALSLGTKANAFLPLLSVALIAVYIFFSSKANLRHRLQDFSALAGFTLLAIFIFALPSGYFENYRLFGHPVGPKNVRAMHAFEGKPLSYIVENGTKNLLRYGFEFLSLDGMPTINPVLRAQTLIRSLPETAVRKMGLDLETDEATRAPFDLQKWPSSHENGSYWGVFGFGLVWIVVFLSLAGRIKSADIRILSLAAVLFLLTQAYSGPYDPWRGRYFTTCAIFAVPAIGRALQKNRLVRGYLLLLVWVGCISAVSAVVLRQNSALVSVRYHDIQTKSIFAMNRMEQLTRNRPKYYQPLRTFERLVPPDAAVAVFLPEDSFEYPLFGKDLTRTILPINSFSKGPQPVPANAEYLLYSQNIFPCPLPDDIHLGADWYLRRLTDANRQCP